ncbi:MAG: thermonuclease family protein [Gammaproteobacteria bacterium]|nr:thermonuclease family protein [Gammaproteobacteria bacterium]
MMTWAPLGTTFRRVVVISLLIPVTGFAASTLKGNAFIEDDGALRVRGKTIQLYGIHIPETARTCRRSVRPAKCASRAALALDFKVGTGFVECAVHTKHGSRSLTAACYVDGEDLSAYLLRLGWAVALPDAPVEYVTLEKIARSRKLGVWGFPIGEH